MIIKFGLDAAIGGGVGYIAGAFTPSVLRKIKALFVSTSKSLEARVSALEAKIVSDGQAELKKL